MLSDTVEKDNNHSVIHIQVYKRSCQEAGMYCLLVHLANSSLEKNGFCGHTVGAPRWAAGIPSGHYYSLQSTVGLVRKNRCEITTRV